MEPKVLGSTKKAEAKTLLREQRQGTALPRQLQRNGSLFFLILVIITAARSKLENPVPCPYVI